MRPVILRSGGFRNWFSAPAQPMDQQSCRHDKKILLENAYAEYPKPELHTIRFFLFLDADPSVTVAGIYHIILYTRFFYTTGLPDTALGLAYICNSTCAVWNAWLKTLAGAKKGLSQYALCAQSCFRNCKDFFSVTDGQGRFAMAGNQNKK